MLNITRTASLSRHTAPAFVLASGLELIQLRKLSHLAFRLYIELLAMADHSTGRISTSYAVLLALLDFDAVDCRNADDKPTLRRVRTALEALASLKLVRVDRIKNEKAKGLFLKVQSRAGISAPAESNGRPYGRPARAKTPAESSTSGTAAPELRQTLRQGVQEEFIPPTPNCPQTPPKPAKPPAELLQKVRERRAARGELKGPQGGQTVAPAGHAPRGLRPPESAQADSSPAGTPGQTDEGSTARRLAEFLPALPA